MRASIDNTSPAITKASKIYAILISIINGEDAQVELVQTVLCQKHASGKSLLPLRYPILCIDLPKVHATTVRVDLRARKLPRTDFTFEQRV